VALSETELVCNMALGRIGATPMVAGDLVADVTDEAKQCNLHYEQVRDALLRSHAWRFASQAADLIRDEEADSGTSTDDTNTTLKLYDTDQAWTPDAYNGYYLWITGGTGANQIRLIDDTAATYLTLAAADAFTTVPDDTSTYEIWEDYPPYPWDYQYDLPSDFLRFAKTYPLHELFEIDGAMLKTDETAVTINYIKQVTDPSDFDPLFVDALVLSLAVKLCMPLLHDKAMTDRLREELPGVLARARLVNLQESKTRPTEPTWNKSRSL